MKKNLLCLFTVLCTLSLFTACSDDDDDKSDPTVLDVNASYSGEKLVLTYSNQPLLGKEVEFNTTDGKTATITMKGTLDLASIIGGLLTSKADDAMAPGVVPGETSTTLSNVPLILSGEKYTFEGTDTNNGREIKYSGEVMKDKLTLSVNVTMPTNDLVGTWKLAPIVPGDDWGGANKSQPLYFTWQADAMVDLSGLGFGQLPASAVAILMGGMVSPMLEEVIETITYQADGNIVASYKKKDATDWETSPINLAQYYIKDSKMYVQLNITQIMATVEANKSKATNPLDIIGAIQPLIPYLSAGVPLSYNISDGTAQITLGQDVLKPVLNVLTNETVAGLLGSSLPEQLQSMLPQLPGLMEKTEDISATLVLTK